MPANVEQSWDFETQNGELLSKISLIEFYLSGNKKIQNQEEVEWGRKTITDYYV